MTNLTADQILDILMSLNDDQIREISEKLGPCQIALDLHAVLKQLQLLNMP